MNPGPPIDLGRQRRRQRLFVTTTLLVAIGAAVSALPRPDFSAVWLLAFVLPAVLLRTLHRLGPVLRLRTAPIWAVAVTAQVVTAWAALLTEGEPPPQVLLTCVLIPPMTFMTVRRQASDALLALFLAFCVMLIAVILGRGAPLAHFGVFVLAGSALLQAETRRTALQGRLHTIAGTPRRLRRSVQTVAVGMAVLAIAATLFVVMRALPSLPDAEGRSPGGAAGHQDRNRVGLSEQFELGGDPGASLELQGDKLLFVRDPDGGRVPNDLYLRALHFDRPGLHRWTTVRRPTRIQRLPIEWPRGGPTRGGARIAIGVIDDVRQLLFVPPGFTEVMGTARVELNVRTEALRFAQPEKPPAGYTVSWSDPRRIVTGPLGSSLQIAPNHDSLQRLPDELRTPRLVALAREFTQGIPAERPLLLVRAIATGLERRCSYALREPVGDEGSALENFLFGTSRHGYCMHFASAMAVLLRLADVPARVAVGLYGGDPAPENTDARVFGSQHAHAWVEVPVRGLGWVAFDPAPSAAGFEAARTAMRESTWRELLGGDGTDPDVADEAEVDGARLLDLEGLRDQLGWLIGGALLALALLLLPHLVRRADEATRTVLSPEARSAGRVLGQILQRLAARGRPRPVHAGLERYLRSLASDPDLDTGRLADAFAAYQEVRYAGQPYDDERRARLEAGLAAVKAAPMPQASSAPAAS